MGRSSYPSVYWGGGGDVGWECRESLGWPSWIIGEGWVLSNFWASVVPLTTTHQGTFILCAKVKPNFKMKKGGVVTWQTNCSWVGFQAVSLRIEASNAVLVNFIEDGESSVPPGFWNELKAAASMPIIWHWSTVIQRGSKWLARQLPSPPLPLSLVFSFMDSETEPN